LNSIREQKLLASWKAGDGWEKPLHELKMRFQDSPGLACVVHIDSSKKSFQGGL